MTTARKKLSLGNVTDRAEEREVGGDKTRAWTISPARAEALKQRARDMRRNPTEAQKALWQRLKDKQCGFTFNREVVMGSAIVDFACRTRWLVVETGGDSEAVCRCRGARRHGQSREGDQGRAAEALRAAAVQRG